MAPVVRLLHRTALASLSLALIAPLGLSVAAPASAATQYPSGNGIYEAASWASLSDAYMDLKSGTYDLDDCAAAARAWATDTYGLLADGYHTVPYTSDTDLRCNAGFSLAPPVDVQSSLISFARWKSEDGGSSLTPQYTYTPGIPVTDCEGPERIGFENQVVGGRSCELGTGSGTGIPSDWDSMIKLTWADKTSCLANTGLWFGQTLVDTHSDDIDCDNAPYTRNFALPVLSSGTHAVKLNMNVDGQDFVIGYWSVPAEPAPEPAVPACADVTDWDTAATEAGWSCRVGDQEYEYADFHVMTGSYVDFDGVSQDICTYEGGQLPAQSVTFCSQDGGQVRAIFDWDNPLRSLDWLDEVQQFGLNTQTGQRNQIADGDMAFKEMGGRGGDAISGLDTSNLTSTHSMFYYAKNFNEDLGTWETNNVTDMSRMFKSANAFNNDVSGWDTSNVTNMSEMFYRAGAFDRDLSSWDTSNVTDMSKMFASAQKFNGDTSSWDTSKVTDMSGMFQMALVFNRDLSHFDTSNVIDMSEMFDRASMFRTGTRDWDTSNVTNMSSMFKDAYDDQNNGFNEDISRWNTSNVTDMSFMFSDAIMFNQEIGSWDTSKVTNMSYMFRLSDLNDDSGKPFVRQFNQDLSGWNVLKVEKRDNFDTVPDAQRDRWTGNFCNRGRPFWDTNGKRSCTFDVFRGSGATLGENKTTVTLGPWGEDVTVKVNVTGALIEDVNDTATSAYQDDSNAPVQLAVDLQPKPDTLPTIPDDFLITVTYTATGSVFTTEQETQIPVYWDLAEDQACAILKDANPESWEEWVDFTDLTDRYDCEEPITPPNPEGPKPPPPPPPPPPIIIDPDKEDESVELMLVAPSSTGLYDPTVLTATVTPATTEGYVEFAGLRAVQQAGTDPEWKLLGKAPIVNGAAQVEISPQLAGDFIVYARATTPTGIQADAWNDVTVEGATVQITCWRPAGGVKGKPGVACDGESTRLPAGTLVQPMVKLYGQTSYFPGTGVRKVGEDGTFYWQRKTGKLVRVYFKVVEGDALVDSSPLVRSNRETIEAKNKT